MRVIWTEQAAERLREIEVFVARDDPQAAARLIDRLIDQGDALTRHPDRGRRLPELPDSGLRELIVGNYRIVYRRTMEAVEVLTVFEGHRLLRPEELTIRSLY
jgi:addiction module RelE/StbE family toxin